MKQLLFLIPLLIFISCGKDDVIETDPIVEDPAGESLSNIDFENPEVGQLAYYLLYTGRSYYEEDTASFTYHSDTLAIEITEIISDSEFVVNEYFTPGSNVLNDADQNYYWFDENSNLEIIYSFDGNGMHITSLDDVGFYHSHLTFTESLLPYFPVDSLQMVFDTWVPEPKLGDYVNSINILGHDYDYLRAHVNNEPMAWDGNGQTILHNRVEGVVRSFTYSAWTGDIIGWDLIK